jgi:hypothetical protein
MPKGIYVICSESGSEDKETGLLSLFNIIDKIQFAKGPAPQKNSAPLTQLRMTACWMREEMDKDHDFEFEAVLKLPMEIDEVVIGKGTFIFDNPFFRINVRILGPLNFKGDGILLMESRVRKIGARAWHTHSRPIIIEQIPAAMDYQVVTAEAAGLAAPSEKDRQPSSTK